MLKRIVFIAACSFVWLFITGGNVTLADDLDDGISKATDESIAKDDELGNADKNIKFIIQNAKSRANVRAKAGMPADQQSGANMNSVIMGPGGNVRGDIIIIDQSKGDKTQIVE